MKKMRMIILGIVAALLLSGCGGGSASNMSSSASGAESWDSMAPMEPSASWGEAETNDAFLKDTGTDSASSYQGANVKMIYRASMSIETLNYESAAAGLEALVNRLGGYFESSSVYQGGYYSDGFLRYGSYTVRIPSAQYEVFLSAVSEEENCRVTHLDRETENVGEAYYDAESRLTTQRITLERLQELLSKASKMEDIITLEDAISNVEYEIERLSSTLNRYDGLIDFATVEVQLEQVARLSDMAEEEEGLGTRMLRGLKSGMIDFCDGLDAFLVWCAYHLIGIVVFLAIASVGICCVKRFRKCRRTEKQQKETDPGTADQK